MASTSPVILILGAGPHVGFDVARTFASNGYKVAVAARSLKEEDSSAEQLNIKSDFAKPEDIASVFTKTKEVLGIPSVVFYNGTYSQPENSYEALLRIYSWCFGRLPPR
jgi:NAD(P)-dependent dehydrogenase (short-subunit alcohol dehydrogenase family)